MVTLAKNGLKRAYEIAFFYGIISKSFILYSELISS